MGLYAVKNILYPTLTHWKIYFLFADLYLLESVLLLFTSINGIILTYAVIFLVWYIYVFFFLVMNSPICLIINRMGLIKWYQFLLEQVFCHLLHEIMMLLRFFYHSILKRLLCILCLLNIAHVTNSSVFSKTGTWKLVPEESHATLWCWSSFFRGKLIAERFYML